MKATEQWKFVNLPENTRVQGGLDGALPGLADTQAWASRLSLPPGRDSHAISFVPATVRAAPFFLLLKVNRVRFTLTTPGALPIIAMEAHIVWRRIS